MIGLYPHLLPSDLRQTLSQSHPTKPPTLSGVELEEGTKHLITYLTQVLTLVYGYLCAVAILEPCVLDCLIHAHTHTHTLTHTHTHSHTHAHTHTHRCDTKNSRSFSPTKRGRFNYQRTKSRNLKVRLNRIWTLPL